MTDRFDPPPYPIACDDPTLYQQWDPYGFRIWPSRTIQHEFPKTDPRTITVISNEHGFRSRRELHEPDERTRILVTGDSFVFGLGVEHDERFTNMMEETQPKWRVDNLGMTAYGLDLMLMALEEVGLASNPEILMVCIYSDDLRRVRTRFAGVGYEIPHYTLVNDQLQITPYPRRRLHDSLHLVQVARRVKWNCTNAEWRLNEAILERFVNLSRQHDFQLGSSLLAGQKRFRQRPQTSDLG